MAIKSSAPPKNQKPQAAQLDLPAERPTAAALPRLAYTLQETAKILGLSYISVYRLVVSQKLKCSSAVPGRKLVSSREIEDFLARTTAKGWISTAKR